ncbi:MAG: flagellar hook-associated protein FlgK [Rhodobacteraceae bacterium]|nr:flagellar hook-associated protein FlgK [Paracoccaceae bacterium]
MSISHALNNALSGLTASSRMAEVVSSNLSNVLTDGYGRREVNLGAQAVGGQGAGVEILGIERVVERGVLADRRAASSILTHELMVSNALGRLEITIGEVGDGYSLDSRITALEEALALAASDPSSEQRLANVSDSLNDVATTLNADARAIQAQRAEADAQIADHIDILNTSLKQVEMLNADITRSMNQGADPSALQDQRQVVIDTIAEIVPVREMTRPGGQVALVTASGEILIDGPAQQFEFESNALITADMTFATGRLGGITKDGVPMGVDGLGKLSGGSLSAAFELRDEILPAASDGLDQIAADLIGRFEDPAFDATRVAGTPGLLTDAGAEFAAGDPTGLASRIVINDLIVPAAGGDLSLLRDGIGAVTSGPVGDASQLNNWLDALSDIRALPAGGTPRSAADHSAAWVASISNQRVAAEEDLGFATARYDVMKSAELAGGVDTDQELLMLMKIEQAYAANAKVMQTIESMIHTLMEL